MKKCIAIIAAMLFVLGFAASAFAIHAEIPAETSAIVVKGESTVTIGGELRFRGELIVGCAEHFCELGGVSYRLAHMTVVEKDIAGFDLFHNLANLSV